MTYYLRSDLSTIAKRALCVLLEDGEMLLQAHYWVGSSGRKCTVRTMEGLYERFLVKIVVESRHRNRHAAKLTPVGDYAAREIQRAFDVKDRKQRSVLSEEAQRLIVEAVG